MSLVRFRSRIQNQWMKRSGIPSLGSRCFSAKTPNSPQAPPSESVASIINQTNDPKAESKTKIPPTLRSDMDIRQAIAAAKQEFGELGPDGKPSKEFMDFFSKLAAQVKKTEVTAKQQMLNSPKSQDFRSMVSKRNSTAKEGLRFTADELKQLFFEIKRGVVSHPEAEKLKRLGEKYELVTDDDDGK